MPSCWRRFASQRFSRTEDQREVTTQTLFRDEYPGCTTGPYISQFLLQPVNFGAQSIDTRILTNKPDVDFNTTLADWLNILNGCQPSPSPAIGAGPRVYCYNGRAIAQYVHIDHTGTGLPLPAGMSGAPADIGLGTFGAPTIATLVCEPATRALKHQWYQKWLVHRRLRPEEFGEHVEVQRLGRATYPFHPDLFTSTVLNDIFAKFHSHLLPVAFPEGSPLHTAYGSGHATVAGACVTMLKWFFDESAIVQNPVVPDPNDPTKLIPYVAPKGEAPLTVGGELNKIASNISQARNIAGMRWRTDANAANRLGEEVAIAMLEEFGELFNEPYGGLSVTRFDGTTIRV